MKKYPFNPPRTKDRRRALRNEMPKAELIIWSLLKGKKFGGFKFRRQFGVGSYILDFYCHELRLAIEIDGDSHFFEGAYEYDQRRQKFVERHKIKFLRFTNDQVYHDLSGVIDILQRVIGSTPSNSPS